MKKIFVMILTVCLLFSCFNMPVNAVVANTVIAVTPVQQQRDNWCWAACAQMASKSVYPSTTRTQSNIVSYIKGSIVDQAGNIVETANGAKYATYNNKSFSYSTSSFQWAEIRNYLANDKPIIAGLRNGYSGHMVIIYGCQYVEYNGVISYKINYIDPNDALRYTCSDSDFRYGSAPTLGGLYYYETVYAV